MNLTELRARLAAVPEVALDDGPEVARAIDGEVAYLESAEAIASLAVDTYWPKWRSPWWSMLLLYELGAADRIPARAVAAMVDGLAALPLHTFPIREEEWPTNADRRRHSSCHCALGCIDQVLAACGVDVDRALPWIAPWYARYQMADGGYNCDATAYLSGEDASSMVGTIAPFEAMIGRGPSDACDRAAACLIGRELRRGSPTVHNAEERDAAAAWGALCFPRFYFYDVLRGAAALVRWAATHQRPLPMAAIAPVIDDLLARFPDGAVGLGRVAFADKTTIARDAWGAWSRRPADAGPLQLAVSRPGEPSPTLTRRWAATRRTLIALIDGGSVIV